LILYAGGKEGDRLKYKQQHIFQLMEFTNTARPIARGFAIESQSVVEFAVARGLWRANVNCSGLEVGSALQDIFGARIGKHQASVRPLIKPRV
jgi:hypothetical protein